MKRKMLAQQVTIVCIGTVGAAGIALSASTSFAQTTSVPQKIEKMEITGSNIKRVDAETVAPITIISREDIERSGKATISEVLRDIPQNGGQSYNETFTNSFAPGGSGVALRGLSQKSTLVLINGRRMSNYGFAQNIFDSFVDLNSIPASAVDRIEILRDGASAVYGSDAIAGVVNVILRRDYRGAEIGGGAGTSTEGGLNEYRANLGFGIGDLAKDRYNILVAADYYKRDLLRLSQRKFTADQDFRNYSGGTFNRATLAAWYALNGLPNNNGRTAFPNCPVANQFQAATINPVLSGTTCAYNIASLATLFPKTERLGVLTRGTVNLTGELQGFAEYSYSKSDSFQVSTPGQIANGAVAFNAATNGISIVPNALSANNPSNPFGTPVNILYSFFDVGGRDTKINNDAMRGLAGLKGVIGTWDWESAVGGAKTQTTSISYNAINRFVLSKAITDGTYNFLNPGQGAITAKDLRLSLTRVSDSKLRFFDFKTSGELMQLSTGAVGFAAGIDYRKEELQDRPDANSLAGNVLGQGVNFTSGERTAKAGFVELSVPVLNNLETQFAVRRDSYSDFGSASSPKFGFKWTVAKELLFRGSYSTGFRAPTLPEASKSNAVSFNTVADPLNGNRNFVIGALSQSNSALGAEKSKSINWGVVYEPGDDLSMGADFYKIRLNNLVARDANSFIIAQAIAGNPAFVNKVIRDPANNNQIVYTIRQVRNLGYQETSGLDLDLKKIFKIKDWGRFTFGASYNVVLTFESAITPGAVPVDFVDSNGFGAIPRYKGNVSLAWDKNDWVSNLTYRYIHSYEQQLANVQTEVGSSYTIDTFVGYNGFKNLKLSLSVRNLFDAKPKWDASGGAIGTDFTQYDLRGRYVSLGATYRFK